MDENKKTTKAKKSYKAFDPKKFINTEPRLNEAAKKETVVISFGRMNPITVGHEKLVSKVLDVAVKSKGTPLIFLSQSNDKKKNPLTYDQKIKFGQKAFGKVITKSSSKTIIQIAVELQDKFKNLVMVAGSDRVKDFEALLNKYNGKDYTFDSIRVESAGERDPDADGVQGMSASKMRTAAAENDFDSFKSGLPNKLKASAKEVFDAVRSGMNISEETINEALNNQQRRKRAILMKKLAPKIKRGRERSARKKAPLAKLKDRAHKKAKSTMKDKLAKGKGYSELGFAQRQAIDNRLKKMGPAKIGVLARKLLPSVKQTEKDRFANRNKKESVNEMFELFLQDRTIEEACRIDKVMKRPHMMMASNNTMKFDKRFKMYKSKNKTVDEVIEKGKTQCESNGDEVINLKDIFNLQEAVEKFVTEAVAKIACLKCDEVSTKKAWSKNDDVCPKCNKSTQGVAESLEEAKSDSFTRKFNKIFWWDYSKPKEMQARVRKMTDKQLNDLKVDGWDEKQSGGDGTPRALQIKMIAQEIKRRGLSEATTLDEEQYDAIRDYMAMGYTRREAEAMAKKQYPNESLEESKMSELQDYVDQGKSAEWIAKEIGFPLKDVKAFLSRNESLNEAKKIGSKIQITRGSHKGKTGYIRSVMKGEYGNPTARKFDIDLEDGGETVEYTKDVKLVKESLDEAINKESPLYKEYMDLKSKPVKDLKRIYSQSQRLDTSGYDFGGKANIIADILRGRHGTKRLKVLYNESLDEAKAPKMYNVVKNGKAVNKEPMSTQRALDHYDSLGGTAKGYAVKPVTESGAGDQGTNELVKNLKKDTPNESKTKTFKEMKESLNITESINPKEQLISMTTDKRDSSKQVETLMYQAKKIISALKTGADKNISKELSGAYLDGVDVVHRKTGKTMGTITKNTTMGDLTKQVHDYISKNHAEVVKAKIDHPSDVRTIVTVSDEEANQIKKDYHNPKTTKVRIMKRKDGAKVYLDSKDADIHKSTVARLEKEFG